MKWLVILVLLYGCQRSHVDQEILLQIRECQNLGHRSLIIHGELVCRPQVIADNP